MLFSNQWGSMAAHSDKLRRDEAGSGGSGHFLWDIVNSMVQKKEKLALP